MAAIFQTTFSSPFSWMKMLEFRFQFHWDLFLGGVIDNNSALVQVMAWRRTVYWHIYASLGEDELRAGRSQVWHHVTVCVTVMSGQQGKSLALMDICCSLLRLEYQHRGLLTGREQTFKANLTKNDIQGPSCLSHVMVYVVHRCWRTHETSRFTFERRGKMWKFPSVTDWSTIIDFISKWWYMVC